MKKIFSVIVGLCLIVVVSSCKRTLDVVGEYDINAAKNKAFLKFIHASPNFRKIWNTRDTFNLLVNNTKINSAILTYNGMFPFSVNSSTTSITATYASVPSGDVEIKLAVPGANAPDSFPVLNFTRSLKAGSYYTFLLTDSMKIERDSTRMFVNDAVPEPALPGNYNLRLIHAGMNATDSIDVFSFARNANIITGLKPNAVSSFITLGYNISVVDTIFIRKKATPAGTGPILVKYPLNAVNIGASSLDGRSFTLYYKGDATVATGTKALSVASYMNF